MFPKAWIATQRVWTLRLSGAIFLVFGLTLLSACDTSDPGDDESELITGIEINLTHPSENRHPMATVHGSEGLTSGSFYEADTLVVEPATVYSGSIKLYDESGANATPGIRLQAENYQLFYSVTPTDGIDLVVTDVESNYGSNNVGADLAVGLKFDVTVDEGVAINDGTLRIRVGDFGPGVKNGTTLTVEPIVDVIVPFRVEVPPPPPPDPLAPEGITKAILTLTRQDGTATWTAVAVSDTNLVDMNEGVPDSLVITGCRLGDTGPPQCAQSQYLEVSTGLYRGSWELVDNESGADLTGAIVVTGDRHRFFYWYNFGASSFTITDMDANGLPVGLEFELSIPGDVSGTGRIVIQLSHFAGTGRDVKTETSVGLQSDLRFRIPMKVN